MNNPEKQHTVPQFYLKFFSDENKMVWVFDKQKNEIRKQPVKDTTILRDFYTLETKTGDKDYKIEKDLFSNGIEQEFAPVLKRITESKKIITEDKAIISRFVIFQFGRTEKFNEDYRKVFKQKYEAEITKKFKTTLDRRGIKRIEVTPHKNTNIKGMVMGYKILFDEIKNMSFVLLEAKGRGEEQFLTSDNPITMIKAKRVRDKNGNILKEKMSLIYFPLTPFLSVLFNDYGSEGTRILNKDTVNFLNDALINQSYRYLISRGRKNLLTLTEKDRAEKILTYDLQKFEKAFC